MRIKVFSLSLSTWYQSQARKLYSFWFTRVINSENPSNDRVLFRSPFPSPKAFRSAISWSENPHHHQHFSGDIFRRLFRRIFFFRRYFPTPTTWLGEQREDLQLFSKHQSQKADPRASHLLFFSGSLNPTRRCARARGPLSGAELLPAGSSDAVLHF